MTLGGPKEPSRWPWRSPYPTRLPQRDIHDIHGLRRDRSNPASGHVRRALLAPKKPPTDEDLRCDETEG